jgi:hypothetical protein
MMLIKCSKLEQRRRKAKPTMEARQRSRLFFCWSRHIECMIGFRIDSRTIKRRKLMVIAIIKCHLVN